MHAKYVNIFEGLDTGGIAGKIRNFITTLNDINYESSGCFMMSTNAAYDGSFNEAATKLKTEDIQKMIDLCNQCIVQVINKINEFNSFYFGTYTPKYDEYVAAYKLRSSLKQYITHHLGPLSWTSKNPKWYEAKAKEDAALQLLIGTYEPKMKTDETAINSVSFS